MPPIYLTARQQILFVCILYLLLIHHHTHWYLSSNHIPSLLHCARPQQAAIKFDLHYTVKISSCSQKSLFLTHAVVADILLEQEVPQSMEDVDVSKRCDPTQNKWCNRSGKRELCNVGQRGLGNGKTIPNLQHSLGRLPELQGVVSRRTANV